MIPCVLKVHQVDKPILAVSNFEVVPVHLPNFGEGHCLPWRSFSELCLAIQRSWKGKTPSRSNFLVKKHDGEGGLKDE